MNLSPVPLESPKCARDGKGAVFARILRYALPTMLSKSAP
jgi:hypothetical protein